MKPHRIGVGWIAALLGAAASAQTTERASVDSSGVQGNGPSGESVVAISADGRIAAFNSQASNLVSGDTNGALDVFVHDFMTGATTRVNVDSSGGQANGDTQIDVSMSADGRYVAFDSFASNLVSGDTNNDEDVFVHDRTTGTTTRVSVGAGGVQGNGFGQWASISADGRYVAFASGSTNLVTGDTNGSTDVFVRDLQAGTTTRMSVDSSGVQGNASSTWPRISGDGRYVAFRSSATNLVPGDTNNVIDIFVHDRQTGATTRMSVDSSGSQGNGNSAFDGGIAISFDGRYVAFASDATNLVAGDTNGFTDVFVRDRVAGVTERASVGASGAQGNSISSLPSLSADGRYVAFYGLASNLVPDDSNGIGDIFLRDRQNGTTERVSLTAPGGQGNNQSAWPAISLDARFVAFSSLASNLVAGDNNGVQDVFVRDRGAPPEITTRVSVDSGGAQGSSFSDQPSISAGGRYVAFRSNAADLVAGDTNGFYDAFLYDRQSGTTERVSLSSGGAQGNGPSHIPSVSADGRYVAFVSEANNLVSSDTNNSGDVFVRDRQGGTTERVSVATGGAQGNSNSQGSSISADGRYVAFRSDASNLVTGDTNNQSDVFVRDRQSGTTERVSVATGGAQANSYCDVPAISSDGRYVVFGSYATNLVSGDTNGAYDIFVHDRQLNTTERVSVATGGAQANFDSYSQCSISADGRFVAFESDATNLVTGDTNGSTDVFVRDRQAGTTERVSVASGGAQANMGALRPSISADGRFVVFRSDSTNLVAGDTNGFTDVFVRDRLTGTTVRASVAADGTQGNFNSGASSPASISADGRFVAFDSDASNLVAGDTNGWGDIFVRDRGTASSFTSFCFGDGTGIACPCGNSGAAGHGCQNSASTGGAVLAASGEASLSSDTVQITSSNELPTAASIFLQGSHAVAPVVFGDGLRCAGGTLKRLYLKPASGGVVTAPQPGDPSISARSSALGDPISLGSTRIYQVYYRDPSTTFCPNPPGGTFNVSGAIAIAWGG